jgi:hypothetical protein
MNNTTLISIAVLVVILIAIIFNDKVKATFKGFNIGTDNRHKKNNLDLEGRGNKVKQGTRGVTEPISETNTLKARGDENEIEQG